MEKEKIIVIRLDTDDPTEIRKFKELWFKLKADVVFVPKSIKFRVEGNIIMEIPNRDKEREYILKKTEEEHLREIMDEIEEQELEDEDK